MMTNNVLSGRVATRFLQGVELVKCAREAAGACSENWTYPKTIFGGPGSPYYAEIWVDGMDWQHNYYILEAGTCEEVLESALLMQFEDHNEEEKFNRYDLNQLWDAVCTYRMGIIVFDNPDYSSKKWPNDSVWPFLRQVEEMPG